MKHLIIVLIGFGLIGCNNSRNYSEVKVKVKYQDTGSYQIFTFKDSELPMIVWDSEDNNGSFLNDGIRKCYVNSINKQNKSVSIKCFIYGGVFATNIKCEDNRKEDKTEFYIGTMTGFAGKSYSIYASCN